MIQQFTSEDSRVLIVAQSALTFGINRLLHSHFLGVQLNYEITGNVLDHF